MTWVKICGVTNAEDARLVVDAGASAIGLNFVSSSKRRVGLEQARSIVEALAGALELVAIVADPSDSEVATLRDELGIDWLQLHGEETPARLAEFLPLAYKAAPIGSAEDVTAARAFGGERLLVDTKLPGAASGGSGQSFDWKLVQSLVAERKLILAGGLNPDNVGEAVRALQPWGVDVASGVEAAPGRKDATRIRAFVRAALGG